MSLNNKFARILVVILAVIQLVASTREGYRPKPGRAYWSQKEEQTDLYSLGQQGRSDFSDNDEISSITQSLAEAKNEVSAHSGNTTQNTQVNDGNQTSVSVPQSTGIVQSQSTDNSTTAQVAQSAEEQAKANDDKGNRLSLSQAKNRKMFIKDVNYTFTLALAKGERYMGHAIVNFELKKVPEGNDEPIFLDFLGQKVNNLVVNGEKISSKGQYHVNGMIMLTRGLKQGKNQVKVNFINKYRNDGNGLHSLVDKVDGKQYLYTDFEPAWGHLVFPLFDQPDLRAAYRLRVVVPEDWNVISNEFANANRSASDRDEINQLLTSVSAGFNQTELYKGIQNKKTIVFNRSAKIATYLYAMIVGPYEYVESNVEGLPPMRIYMRSSVIKQVSKELIDEHFFVSQTGMKLYKELFGMPYAFHKFDQIFVPEFNSGAMENVGAVTHNEDGLKIGQNITLHDRMKLANVNLHELAHHWFGNLVTMKWWNDLWLNESFATYMSYLVQTSSKELAHLGKDGGAWLDFMRRKIAGFETDAHSSTHPVRNDVASLAETEAIFDSISYGKGASYLKQVTKMFGRDALSRALSTYFKKYQWQNAEYKDLIQCFENEFKVKMNQTMGKNLTFSEWSNQWLTSSGVNTLQPIVEYHEDGSIKSLSIKQLVDPFGANRLRKSMLDIGVYDSEYKLHVISDVVISEKEEMSPIKEQKLSALKGVPVSAIVLNHGDHAYTKVHFDDRTMQNLQLHGYQKFDEPLTRMLIIQNLWLQMVDEQLPSSVMFNLTAQNIQQERDETVLLKMLEQSEVLVSDYLPRSQFNQSKEVMFDKLFALVGEKDVSDNAKKDVIGKLHHFIQSDKSVIMARNWLESGHIGLSEMPLVENKPLDKEQRYGLMKALCSLRNETLLPKSKKMEMLANIAGDDNSVQGEQVRIHCKYALPEESAKQEAWKIITEKSSTNLSRKMIEEVISAFQQHNQQDLVAHYVNDLYFDKLFDVFESNGLRFYQHFMNTLPPKQADILPDHINKLKAVKAHGEQNHPSKTQFPKEIQTITENLERMAKIRDSSSPAADMETS